MEELKNTWMPLFVMPPGSGLDGESSSVFSQRNELSSAPLNFESAKLAWKKKPPVSVPSASSAVLRLVPNTEAVNALARPVSARDA